MPRKNRRTRKPFRPALIEETSTKRATYDQMAASLVDRGLASSAVLSLRGGNPRRPITHEENQ